MTTKTMSVKDVNQMILAERYENEVSDFYLNKDRPMTEKVQLMALSLVTEKKSIESMLLDENKTYSFQEIEQHMLLQENAFISAGKSIWEYAVKFSGFTDNPKPVKVMSDKVLETLNRFSHSAEALERKIDSNLDQALSRHTSVNEKKRILAQIADDRRNLNAVYSRRNIAFADSKKKFNVDDTESILDQIKFYTMTYTYYLAKKMMFFVLLVTGGISAVGVTLGIPLYKIIATQGAILSTVNGSAIATTIGNIFLSAATGMEVIAVGAMNLVGGAVIGKYVLITLGVLFIIFMLSRLVSLIDTFVQNKVSPKDFHKLEKEQKLLHKNYIDKIYRVQALIKKQQIQKEQGVLHV